MKQYQIKLIEKMCYKYHKSFHLSMLSIIEYNSIKHKESKNYSVNNYFILSSISQLCNEYNKYNKLNNIEVKLL